MRNLVLTSIHLITYGCGNKFEPEKFKPIKNIKYPKPRGGLWASPVNSEHSWIDWCTQNYRYDTRNYWYDKGATSFEFTYKGNTLIIDRASDLESMSWEKISRGFYVPDYNEMLNSGVDAIWLTAQGEYETRYSEPKSLYGWDCECVLIMNPSSITQKTSF